jgi:hypothetical protein
MSLADWQAVLQVMREDDTPPPPPPSPSRKLYGADDYDEAPDDDEDDRDHRRAAATTTGTKTRKKKKKAKPRRAYTHEEGTVDKAQADYETSHYGVQVRDDVQSKGEAAQLAAEIRARSKHSPRMAHADAAALIGLAIGHALAAGHAQTPDHSSRRLRVALVPGSRALHCVPQLAYIHFGARVVDDTAGDGETSGYRLERAPLERHVRDKEGFIAWFALHELVHYLLPHEVHTKAFFAMVESIAADCPFLFNDDDQHHLLPGAPSPLPSPSVP